MSKKSWLLLATVGCALVVIAFIVTALVTFDKPHFGWLVGTWFLYVLTSGVIVGSVLILIGAFNIPERRTWRGLVLILWALIALTSPLFGLLFLLPWGVLVVTLPVVIAVLVALFRTSV
jgi:MFS family permease